MPFPRRAAHASAAVCMLVLLVLCVGAVVFSPAPIPRERALSLRATDINEHFRYPMMASGRS